MNDLVFVLRMLRRHPLILGVNVTGLGLALTTVILTLTFLRYELSYDNHFKTRDRVVRLYSRVTDNTSSTVYGISLREAYSQLPAKVPEIEAAVQFYGGWPTSLATNNSKISNVRLGFADNEIFKVFGLGLLSGDPGSALSGMRTAVITKPVAEKLFKSGNCIGKTIESDGTQFIVTGVMNEIPKNSHFGFDVLFSLSTLHPEQFGSLEFQTYYLLKQGTDQKAAGAKIASANNELMRNWATATNSKVQSGVEPLKDLYLHSAASNFIPRHGSPGQLVVVGLIALFVLLTALLSYINLFIIQGEKRIAEISTRTMFGATKANIARLFFIETAIVFSISAVLAFLVTYLSLPYYAALLISGVELSDLLSGWGISSVLIVLSILLILTSGYPVLYLTRMKYTQGLRGKFSSTGKNNWFSSASVFVQFMVTSFFISCVFIIILQIKYMHKVPMGFDADQVTVVSDCSMPVARKYESVKSELLKLPFVTAVCGGEHFMGGGCSGQYIRNTTEGENNNKAINEYREKPGFSEIMRLQLLDGRFFRESMADSLAVVLNESAMKLLGLKPLAGQTVLYNDKRMEVIGVVKDFYYLSNPGEAIQPLVIANCFRGTPNIYIRSRISLNENQKLQLKSIFQRFDENFIFNPQLIRDVFRGMYRQEYRLAIMVTIGSAEVAIISLISLLALTILKISRRTKEIGIRKVLGSSVGQIIFRLLREILILVTLAIILASVASSVVMNLWLRGYYKHLSLDWGYFVYSAIFAFAIAAAATIGQSWHAAARNPVDAVKCE